MVRRSGAVVLVVTLLTGGLLAPAPPSSRLSLLLVPR